MRLFVPLKEDNTFVRIRKIIFIAAILVVIICGLCILANQATRAEDLHMNEDLQQMAQLNAEGTFSIESEKVEEIKAEVPEILDKFVELYNENSDIVGWLTVGDCISYPVMMNEEETDYYLYRNFYKQDSVSGSIFCDNHVLPITDANNLVIYGHNMASGEYFANLNYYNPMSSRGEQSFINYYQEFPTLEFDTLYEEGTYKIFAGMYINTREEDGYPYPYYKKRQFKTEADFMDFMGNIMDRSLFYTDVDVEYGDQILTLSTCFWYPFEQDLDLRFVLFARKVRDGESADVDVSKLTINDDPLLFDTYYERMGGSWGGRNWDLSLVKDFDKYSDKVDSLDNYEPDGALADIAANYPEEFGVSTDSTE